MDFQDSKTINRLKKQNKQLPILLSYSKSSSNKPIQDFDSTRFYQISRNA